MSLARAANPVKAIPPGMHEKRIAFLVSSEVHMARLMLRALQRTTIAKHGEKYLSKTATQVPKQSLMQRICKTACKKMD